MSQIKDLFEQQFTKVFAKEAAFENYFVTPLFSLLGYLNNGKTRQEKEVPLNVGSFGKGSKEIDYVLYINDKPIIAVEVEKSIDKCYDGIQQIGAYSMFLGSPLSLYIDPTQILLYKSGDIKNPIFHIKNVADFELVYYLKPENLIEKVLLSLYQLSSIYFQEFPYTPITDTSIKDFYLGFSDYWFSLETAKKYLIERSLKTHNKTYREIDFIKQIDSQNTKLSLIFGPGGAGKTTYLRTLSTNLKESNNFIVFYRKENSFFDEESMNGLIKHLSNNPLTKKLIFIYDINIPDTNSLTEVSILSKKISTLPNVSILVSSRKEDWEIYSRKLQFPIREVYNLVEKISSNDRLKLESNLKEIRNNVVYENDSDEILLSYLYKITFGCSLKDYVLTEFERIEEQDYRDLYLLICGLTKYNIKIDFNFLKLFFRQYEISEIFEKKLADIVYLVDGFIRVRHKVIAEIIWKERFTNQLDEIDFLHYFITEKIISQDIELTDKWVEKIITRIFLSDSFSNIPFMEIVERIKSTIDLDILKQGGVVKVVTSLSHFVGKISKSGSDKAGETLLLDFSLIIKDPYLISSLAQRYLAQRKAPLAILLLEKAIVDFKGSYIVSLYDNLVKSYVQNDNKAVALEKLIEGMAAYPKDNGLRNLAQNIFNCTNVETLKRITI
jgi:energy-coupling factor transporter ATP-binding protein EcfA2